MLLLLQPAYMAKHIDCRIHVKVLEDLEIQVTLVYELHGVKYPDLAKLLPDIQEDAEKTAAELFGRRVSLKRELISNNTIEFHGSVSGVVEEREHGLMMLKLGSLTLTRGVSAEKIPRYLAELEVAVKGFYVLSASPEPRESTATRAVWEPAPAVCTVEFCKLEVSVSWEVIGPEEEPVQQPYKLAEGLEYNLSVTCKNTACIPLKLSASLVGYNATLLRSMVGFQLNPAESTSFVVPFRVSAGSWIISLEVKDNEGLGVYKRVLIVGSAAERPPAEEVEAESGERTERVAEGPGEIALHIDVASPEEVYAGDSFLVIVTVINEMDRSVVVELRVNGTGVKPAEVAASKEVEARSSSVLEVKLTATRHPAELQITADMPDLNYTIAKKIRVAVKLRPSMQPPTSATPSAAPSISASGTPSTAWPQPTHGGQLVGWLKAVIAIVAAGAIAVALMYMALRSEGGVAVEEGAASHEELRKLEEERERVLSRIKELEEAYGTSLISDRVYRELEKVYRDELEEIERRLKRLRGSTS
ncbi:MAG: hypothetical protein DRN99_02050 [Thermoproteota archaeon]|nr:MAG: hypothetical protein DRN99_02050 [Candidatus Korarchaeota archaeon]